MLHFILLHNYDYKWNNHRKLDLIDCTDWSFFPKSTIYCKAIRFINEASDIYIQQIKYVHISYQYVQYVWMLLLRAMTVCRDGLRLVLQKEGRGLWFQLGWWACVELLMVCRINLLLWFQLLWVWTPPALMELLMGDDSEWCPGRMGLAICEYPLLAMFLARTASLMRSTSCW